MVRKLALLTSLCFLGFSLFSQNLNEGIITYQSENDIDELWSEHDGKLFIERLAMSFDPFNFRIDEDLRVARSTTIVGLRKNKALKIITYGYDMFSLRLDLDEYKEVDQYFQGYEIKFSEETLFVEGYECFKAIVTLEDGTILEYFYTEEIQPSFKSCKYFPKELPGVPLIFDIYESEVINRLRASGVYDEANSSENFVQVTPVGYQEYSLEEYKKMTEENAKQQQKENEKNKQD